MFNMSIQKRVNKQSKWCEVENHVILDNPFTYGKIKADRPRAKKDGDSYRVYSESINNGMDYRPKTIITTNKKFPNERVVYTRINNSKTKRG